MKPFTDDLVAVFSRYPEYGKDRRWHVHVFDSGKGHGVEPIWSHEDVDLDRLRKTLKQEYPQVRVTE